MSETTHPTGGLTRRGFLKTTGAAAAGLACAGAVGVAIGGGALAPARATADGGEKTVYTLHQFMCQGNCSIKCTVRDGHLAKIEPSDAVDPKYRRCCMKGLSEIEHVYSPLRLQTPLKRVGERGEGKFEKISWDEALEIVGTELKRAWDAYGKESVYISASNDGRGAGHRSRYRQRCGSRHRWRWLRVVLQRDAGLGEREDYHLERHQLLGDLPHALR